jgi:AraC family transcriptional regulator
MACFLVVFAYPSQCHFQRIFKNATNKTPYQYIIEFRINKSKEKLKEDIPIAEIARLCGFLSGGHFSTVFKIKYFLTQQYVPS